MAGKITEDTTLEELLRRRETISVLFKYGLPCLTCPMARFEMGNLKIGEVARAYNIDVKALLEDLNKAVGEG